MLDDPPSLASAGFEIVPDVLAGQRCIELADQVTAFATRRAGTRLLLDHDSCRELAIAIRQHPSIAALLPDRSVAVQCTLFDKTPQRNWQVAFHQDASIPVRSRVNSPLCSGWSEKEGMLFAQPPITVLSQLLAVRIHLDDCGLDNGPLKVVPASHQLGRIAPTQTARYRAELGESVCIARRGAALLMRPLLLHASSKARIPSPRRVLHYLMGPPELPLGLEWHRAA